MSLRARQDKLATDDTDSNGLVVQEVSDEYVNTAKDKGLKDTVKRHNNK